MNGTIVLSARDYGIQPSLIFTRSSIRELKEEVPSLHYDSLRGIWEILKNEVLNPLGLSQNNEDFERRIQSVIPDFLNLKNAFSSLLLSYYRNRIEQFEDDITSTLYLLEEKAEKKAKKYFASPEILTLQSILFTIRRIAPRTIQWLIKNENKFVKKDENIGKFYHFYLLLDLYLTFIFSIIEGEIKLRRKGLLKTSLSKAKEYSNKCFHYAKEIGILTPTERKKYVFPEKLSHEAIKSAEESTHAYMDYLVKKLKKEDG